jgi:hypothetical protein
MRTIPIAAAALLSILAATAGLATTPNQPGPLAQATLRPQATHEAVNPLTKGDISGIEGIDVYGNEGKLGYVSTVLIDPQTKKPDRLIVAAGGVLGIGGRRVAIPVDQFKWEPDKGAFRLMTTMAGLRSMPEWVEGAETATGSSAPPPAERPTTGDKTSR